MSRHLIPDPAGVLHRAHRPPARPAASRRWAARHMCCADGRLASSSAAAPPVIAVQGGPHSVTSNTVCPGYVRTPLVDGQIANQAQLHGIEPSQVISDIMLPESAVKRLIEPGEVTELVAYLCSAQAGFAKAIPGCWTAAGRPADPRGLAGNPAGPLSPAFATWAADPPLRRPAPRSGVNRPQAPSRRGLRAAGLVGCGSPRERKGGTTCQSC